MYVYAKQPLYVIYLYITGWVLSRTEHFGNIFVTDKYIKSEKS